MCYYGVWNERLDMSRRLLHSRIENIVETDRAVECEDKFHTFIPEASFDYVEEKVAAEKLRREAKEDRETTQRSLSYAKWGVIIAAAAVIISAVSALISAILQYLTFTKTP